VAKNGQKSPISFGLFSKIKKAKGVEKGQKFAYLASKKPNWQPNKNVSERFKFSPVENFRCFAYQK